MRPLREWSFERILGVGALWVLAAVVLLLAALVLFLKFGIHPPPGTPADRDYLVGVEVAGGVRLAMWGLVVLVVGPPVALWLLWFVQRFGGRG